MKEASPVKYYFAKYFFLAFGILQWICGTLLFLQNNVEKGRKSALLFFILGLTFVAIYFMIAARLKRVAIGKKRIAVMESNKVNHYEWPEVKSIRAIPYFNLYTLKLKGRKERIYFLPQENAETIFGLFSAETDWAEAFRKKGK
ncbi:MAG TPA: hypothetical protein PLR06_14090 [Cyclobacteriaceae bacterium]|nr:hypothetical protein [Cyclobacteriaceae bacterium]